MSKNDINGEDILSWLKGHQCAWDNVECGRAHQIAAAEIERLRDSNEVLTEQVKRMDAEVERAEAKVAKADAQRERDRVRVSMSWLRSWYNDNNHHPRNFNEWVDMLRSIGIVVEDSK